MACDMCLNAHVDPDLTSDNDLSFFSIGRCEKSYRLVYRSGDGKPTSILAERWNIRRCCWEEIGFYHPKFCPNCGRRLTENGLKEKDRP